MAAIIKTTVTECMDEAGNPTFKFESKVRKTRTTTAGEFREAQEQLESGVFPEQEPSGEDE